MCDTKKKIVFIPPDFTMSCEEDQEEEREVLRSIYESDKNFIEINPTTFQYKFGEEGHYKSFLLEISWPADYPTCLPNIGLNAFYNRHISSTVKESVTGRIKEQCEMCVGSAMTFSIFDWTKEHEEELMTEQQEVVCGVLQGRGSIIKSHKNGFARYLLLYRGGGG